MGYPKLNNIDAQIEYEKLVHNNFKINLMTDVDKEIRRKIVSIFQQAKTDVSMNTYAFDLEVSKGIYEYFQKLEWFTKLAESDYDFWKYIAIRIMPDLIYERHGDIAEYYYKKNVRIYPFRLYWYFHLSFNEDIHSTYSMLKKPVFSTDTILQIVERPGKSGLDLDTFRTIIRKYSKFETKYYVNKNDVKFEILRSIMILNTAKNVTIFPSMYQDGIEGYVDLLINEALKGAKL